MTFRGVYKNGVIVPDLAVDLPDGARVEFYRSKKPARASKDLVRKKKSTKRRVAGKSRSISKAKQDLILKKSFGMWKDRSDWKGKSTLEIAAELRRLALGRNRG